VELARLIREDRGAAVGVGLVVAAPALKFIHLDQLADLLSAGPDRPGLSGLRWALGRLRCLMANPGAKAAAVDYNCAIGLFIVVIRHPELTRIPLGVIYRWYPLGVRLGGGDEHSFRYCTSSPSLTPLTR
jgi:hypothetical protein